MMLTEYVNVPTPVIRLIEFQVASCGRNTNGFLAITFSSLNFDVFKCQEEHQLMISLSAVETTLLNSTRSNNLSGVQIKVLTAYR